jgi:Ras-related protein Rab-5C
MAMQLRPRPRAPTVISAIIGRHGVGKTSLIQAFSMPSSSAPRQTSPTIGAAVINQLFPIPDEVIGLAPGRSNMGSHTIWDTAGQERYASLVPMYTRNCDILILAMPADEDPNPLVIRQLLCSALPPIRSPKVIKGALTKCDLVSRELAAIRCDKFRNAILESPQALNRQFEVQVFATSAYTGEGVDECMLASVPDVYAFKLKRWLEQASDTVVVDEGPSPTWRRRCTGMCMRKED